MATGTRYATLQRNLGYDMFWVVGKSAYSMNQIVIACLVTFRDLSKLTSSRVCALRTSSCCTDAVQLVHNLRTFQNADNVPVGCASGHPCVSGRFETGGSVVYVCVEKHSQQPRPKNTSTDMEPSGTRSAHTANRPVGPVSSMNYTLSLTD